MKNAKIRLVLVLSLLILTGIVAVSLLVEGHSQKLPAVVFSEKVIVSSKVDGVLKHYAVSSMQKVARNDLIADVLNSNLLFKLETLRKEKNKYVELIQSSRSGDIVKLEQYDLEGDIQRNRIDLDKAGLELNKAKENILLLRERYASARKMYDASRKLYEKGILNTSDYDKASKDFWNVSNEYTDLQADSLVAFETVKSSQKIIRLLQALKDIISGNADILASKYLIDLNDVEADINDLEEEIKNLKVYAPIAGIVTDINHLPGEKIDKGDVIAEVADLSNVWVIAYGTSYSRHKVKVGQKVRIISESRKNIAGKVVTVSPVMEKVKALGSNFETANTYTKIEIKFDDMEAALRSVTPGERLFVRIYF